MNTNETQEIEIPPDADWIDPLKSWKRGFRAGVEAMRGAVQKICLWAQEGRKEKYPEYWDGLQDAIALSQQEANKLLTKGEKE